MNTSNQEVAHTPLACSLALYRTYVLNGGNINHREIDRMKAMFAELPQQCECTEVGIYRAIHDYFTGALPDCEPINSVSPYAHWQSEHSGERLGVALLRIKVQEAIEKRLLWSERLPVDEVAA